MKAGWQLLPFVTLVYKGKRVRRFGVIGLPLLLALVGLGSLLTLIDIKPSKALGVIRYATPSGSGSACTEIDPCALQTAVDQSTSDDEIRAAAGTYSTGSPILAVNKTITVTGGYDSGNWSLAPNPQLNPTILDGQNSTRVVSITGSVNPTIEGFVIRHGVAEQGAGVMIGIGAPLIRNNIIHNNDGTQSGGTGAGIHSRGPAIIINNSIFENQAASLGGGIYIDNGTSGGRAEILFNDIYSNTAVSTGGGGLFLQAGAQAFIEGNALYNNQSVVGGGFGTFGTTAVTNTLQNNFIYNNQASDVGGGIFALGQLNILNNTIAANSGTNNGGGLYVESGAVVQINSTIIVSNTGSSVSGIRNAGGTVSGDYNNIFDNSSDPTFVNTVTSDPQFINFSTFNLHLLAGSPNEDAGDPSPPLTISQDIDQQPRPNGTAIDIGADEIYPNVPNFILEPENIENFADRGTTAVYTHTLENRGTVVDSYTFTCSNDQNWAFSCPGNVNNLGIGDTVDIQTTVDVPALASGLSVGKTVITATSTTSGTLSQSVLVQTIVTPLPGVAFTPHFTATLLPSETVTFTHILTNTGDSQDVFNITINNDPGGWAEILPDGPFSLPLASGASANVRVRMTVPPFAAAGVGNTAVIEAASDFDPQISATVLNTVTAKATVGTRYVSTTGSDLNNNCTQSTMPCATIERGIGQASFTDEVRIAAGTFIENELNINDTIFVSGGWNSAFNNQGDPSLTVINPVGSTRLVNIAPGSNIQPTIENLTLENGNGGSQGGAIQIGSLAQPELTSLILQNNLAGRAGALYVGTNSFVTISNTQILSNTATTLQGGALFVDGGTVILQNSQLINNRATIQDGGAVYLGNGLFTSKNNLYVNNQAGSDGGGLFTSAGILDADHNTYVSNSATGDGGALYNNSAALNINSSIIVSNTAISGAAVFDNSGTGIIAYSDIWNNSSTPETNVSNLNNNISADPRFADATYHLGLGSPAIDTADPASILQADFEGDFRPSDQGFDMGYDELPGCTAKRDATIFGSIQAAVDMAGAVSDLILVSGTCRGVNTITVDSQIISQTVHLTETVTLQGGWNGDFSQFTGDPTLIDPEGRGRGVYISGPIQPEIEYITIINGDATNLGGGLANADAGGGLYNANADVTLTAVSILTNSAELGGGIYNAGGTLIINADFEDEEPQFTFFSGNNALDGGAIYIEGGLTELNASHLTQNSASNGGGIYIDSGTVSVTNAILDNNTALNDGGAIVNNSPAQVNLLHNTLYSNTAVNNGGGFYSEAGSPSVRNNIFEGNQALAGSAVFVNAGSPDLDYNYYHNQSSPIFGATPGPNSIDSATPPGLLDPDAGDFHLADDAPAVDVGDPNSPILTDFDDDPRPSNQSVDMGADEVAGCRVFLNGIIFGSIQAAMETADPGDAILVSGTCSGVHQYDTGLGAGDCRGDDGFVNTTVHIDKDIILQGGWDENFNNQNSITTLDALNLGRVIYIAPGTSPTIENFDIIQGNLSGINANGAGICSDQASPTILNNNIYSNTAINGAGIYGFESATAIKEGNRIYNNTATGDGGGIAINNTTSVVAAIQNNFIYSNTAVNGGAFYNVSGHNLLWHNTIVNNTATNEGGAVFVNANAPEIRGNLVIRNTATNTDGAFGAPGSLPVLSYNDFFGQTIDFGGTIVTGGTGAVSVDPRFEDESFIISLDSPVVDIGDPTLPLTEDFELDIRPSHQGMDIGADEISGCFAYINTDPDTIYGSLQLAVDTAAAGDTIFVDGICYGVNDRTNDGGSTVTQNLFIDKNLTIDGDWRSGLHPSTTLTATLDAQNNGRVVYIDAGSAVTLTNITLQNGDAVGAGNGTNGGGLYNDGTLLLDQVSLQNNSAALGGGLLNAAVLIIENSILSENSATDGAGFYNDGTANLLGGTLFWNNTAVVNGGGLYQAGGNLRIDGINFYENVATNGGGLYLASGTTVSVDIFNNFIVRNQAPTGGGIYNSNTDADLLHNTLYANSGDGIFSAVNTPIIRNNIVDFSTGTGIHAPAGTNIDYNNVVNNTGLAYDGGATAGANDISETPSYIDSNADNFHLVDNSPGVDEADPSSPLSTDYDGDVRPTNGGPDMGADEINSCLIRVISPADSSNNIFGVMQEAIDYAEGFVGAFTLPTIEITRGECRGVQFDAGLGTSQVGYVQEDLTFIGSLRRSNFSDPGDLYSNEVGAISTRLNAEGDGRVIVIAAGADVTFTQLAFINGDASAGGGNGNGGAFYLPGNSTIELEEIAICQNQAVNGGGYFGGTGTVADITGVRIGICTTAQVSESSNGAVQSVDYTSHDPNVVTGNGGGLFTDGRLDVRNVSFYWNRAGQNGGGIYNNGDDNRIINGTIYSNTAQLEGGGIYHNASRLSLYHNTLVDNLANGGDGGAVWHNDANFILNSSILYANTAVNNGGGLSSDAGSLAYNLFNSNAPNNTPGNAVGSNAILSDPLLFGTILSIDSPAIDQADPDLLISGAPGAAPFGTVVVDFDRQLDIRPDGEPNHNGLHGKGADMGSDEYFKDFGCFIEPTSNEATAVPGQTVTYTFNILNSGRVYPPTVGNPFNGYTDTLTITLQSSQGWGLLEGGNAQTVNLGWLEDVDRTITVTVPATATTGLQDVSSLSCQSASLASRTDNSNATTNVGLVAGVVVVPNYNDTALPGDVITYSHEVINLGNEAGTFELTPNSGPQNANAVLVDDVGTILTNTFVTLEPNESVTVLLRVNILTTAAANDLATPGVVAIDESDSQNSGASLNEILIGFAPGTRHVAKSGAADNTNCTDPANPCATIQYAIDQSVDGDSILISTGTYTDTVTQTIGVDTAVQNIYIDKSLRLQGGYNVADGFTSNAPITNAVTLDGQDSQRVMLISDGITVSITSLFVTNGAADGQGFAPTDGGGLYNQGASLTITGTWFTANTAQFGGGLYHQIGDLIVNSSVFAVNQKAAGAAEAGQGGAVFLASGSNDIENNTFDNNSADNISGGAATGDGGALYAASGSLDLVNNIFSNNSGNANARAAFVVSPTVVLTNDYNLYWSNLALIDQTNFITGTNSFTADPLYEDGFYHISANSAAKDTGTNAGLTILDVDFELDGRPQGAFVDIGADERVQRPDFTFEPITQTAVITAGARYTYTHIITNTGDQDDSYTLTMTNQSIPSGGGFGYDLSPLATAVISPGDSITVTFVITGGLPGFVDETIITAASSSLISKSVTDTTTISQTAGVEIEQSEFGTGFPGQTITYSHTIINTGDGVDQFMLAPITATAVPTGWIVSVTPTQTTFLNPAESAPFTVTVEVPPGTLSDTVHTVQIEATADDPVASDRLTDTTTVGAAYGLSLKPDNAQTVADNTEVIYTHTLQNIGNLTDTVQLSFSTAPSWTVDVQPLTVTLQPLQTQWVTVTVTVPPDTGGQTHTAVISATSQGDLTVTAVNTTTVSTIAGVLLEPDSTIIANAGEIVTHTHTLTNLGNITDTFDISSTTNMGWLVETTPGPITLSPGMTGTVTATVAIPLLALPSDSDVTIITATSQLTTTVFDTVTATTRVQQQPGIQFEPNNTFTTSAGTLVTYTHTLTNTGNGSDSYILSSTSSRGWPVSLPPGPITLTAGSSTPVVVTITVPIGGSGLTDTMHVTATSTISSAFTAVVTNSTFVTGTPGSLGVLIGPNNSRDGLPGGVVTYTHLVTNTGNITETFSLDVLSDSGWTTAVSPTTILLNPADSDSLTVTVTIPVSATNGTTDIVTVTTRSDTDAMVFDTAVDTTTVGQLFGVEIGPDNSANADAGTIVTYTHIITNTGNGTDTFNITAVSDNGWDTAVPADITLGGGMTTTLVVSLTIPAGASGFVDTMTVTANSTLDNAVFDTAENVTTIDGAVGTLDVTLTPNNADSGLAGTTVQYEHTLRNAGTVTDDYGLTAVSSQGWIVTVTPQNTQLTAGQTTTVLVRVTIPLGETPGTVDTTTVTVTSETSTAVSDSASNTTTVEAGEPEEQLLYLPIVINQSEDTTPPPPPPTPTPCTPTGVDLVVTEIRVEPAIPVAGESATVFVTMLNQGSVDVTFGNNFFLDFYVDRVPAALLPGDIVWGIQGSIMDAGTSQTFSGTTIFSGGSHQLYAQADTDNTVDECPLEDNNVLGPIFINVSGSASNAGPSPEPKLVGPRQTPTPGGPAQFEVTPIATPSDE